MDATFRRAVGLHFWLRPCVGLAHVEVTASRLGGDTRTVVSLEDAALLFRLGRWRTATECGADHARLVNLVSHNLLYWSPGRPTQTLTGGPVERLEAGLALRANVFVTPVVQQPDKTHVAPFMPRMGALDRARVVGVQLDVTEMDQRTHSVTVGCCQAHGAQLRDWMAALDGSVSCAELVASVGDSALLDALNRMGVLENRAPRPAWDGRPQVTWLGHAAVLVETAGQRLLVDPLFHARTDPARPGADVPPDPASVGRVDGVFITHGDHDHLNAASLARIHRDTPVFIPHAAVRQPWHVDMARLLALMGFSRVREVSPGDVVTLGDVRVHAFPFHGEDWGLALPQLTWLVQSQPLTVFLNADSLRMDAVYAQVARDFRVDVAFVGVTGCSETHAMPPGFGYGSFYETWMPPQRRNQWVDLCGGPTEAADAALKMGARRAFGYAAGGASFIPLAYSDRGTHAQLAAELATRGRPEVAWALPLGVACAVPGPPPAS